MTPLYFILLFASSPSYVHVFLLLLFILSFWYCNCYSSLLLIHFSHPFQIFIFYMLFTFFQCINCYIQFFFLTSSIMTSSSFFNSFKSPFLFFYTSFWYSNCYSSLLLIHFSLSFQIFIFYMLFTFFPCIDCYIQFSSSTSYNMTSSTFFNSFKSPFFIFLYFFLVL